MSATSAQAKPLRKSQAAWHSGFLRIWRGLVWGDVCLLLC